MMGESAAEAVSAIFYYGSTHAIRPHGAPYVPHISNIILAAARLSMEYTVFHNLS